MRKLQFTLLIILSSAISTNGAMAQNKPLACQVDASAGLKWENRRWVTKTFLENKFILVQTENTLTTESASKALSSFSMGVSCRSTSRDILCTDTAGGSLYFDPKTSRGGISQLLGSTSAGDTRDTVTVQIFSCTPF